MGASQNSANGISSPVLGSIWAKRGGTDWMRKPWVAPVLGLLILVVVSIASYTTWDEARLSKVHAGMAESEVLSSIGQPSERVNAPLDNVYQPRGACGAQPVMRCLVYRRTFRDSILVYLGPASTVLCCERAFLFTISSL